MLLWHCDGVTDAMVRAHVAADIRAAEAPLLASVPEGALMDRAAAKLAVICAEVLRQARGQVAGGRVVLVVGSGNNGGDALLAGARLRGRGVQVHALLMSKEAHARGLAALRSAGGRALVVDSDEGEWEARLHEADLVMDGLSGLSGWTGLSDEAARVFGLVPASARVVAVDLPSGVGVDTGEVPGSHVEADVTVTFGAMKPCLLVPPAAYAAGRVEFVDVGIRPNLPAAGGVERLTGPMIGLLWPVPGRRDHKYRRGVLGVVAGSDTYPGAAVLACAGAVRAGVGIVRYIGPPGSTEQVIAARPEVVPGIGQVQAWLLGSGVEDDPKQDEAIDVALASGLPCVVDAGALAGFVGQRMGGAVPARADQLLLTPHAGELTRVLGLLGEDVTREDVEARPLHFARFAAHALDATVLLKGSITLVARPDGYVLSQDDGPPWLATAGSGDVLAGIAGALMAAGVNACNAGGMAASVHGRAGARTSAGGPIASADTADTTPGVIADLIRAGQEWASQER